MYIEAAPAGADSRHRRLHPHLLATIGVYALVIGVGVGAAVWVRVSGADADAPIGKRSLVAGVGAAMAFILGLAALALGWHRAAPSRLTSFHIPVIAHLFVLSICAVVLEVAARLVARPHQLGVSIGATALAPYDWSVVSAFNKSLLQRSRGSSSYYVEDEHLGWAIGASRRSPTGIYVSSAEGLRSAKQGERLFEAGGSPRVAIFGDSFAFSEEVGYEHSLNVHLERRLGRDTRVLNFGVPGFGIDQAVLYFEREAARWKPAVTILQFISDDIDRIGFVYLFNRPQWAYPFVKPRFISRDGKLQQLTLPRADEAYARASIFELPHLELDLGFDPDKWRAPVWTASYALRFAAARLGRDHAPGRQLDGASSNEQLAVALIERFVGAARAARTVPLVVYFPDRNEFQGRRNPSARQVIDGAAARGIEVVDATTCMVADGEADAMFARAGRAARPGVPPASDLDVGGHDEAGSGVHYSDAGNARMAACLAPLVERRVAEHSRTSLQQ